MFPSLIREDVEGLIFQLWSTHSMRIQREEGITRMKKKIH